MAHKNLVGGTAYDTKGGRCLVGGTGYNIKKGRTLVGGTGYDVGFASEITLANITEGGLVKLNENGRPVEFYVAKHDYESGLNGAGRTLVVRKECYDMRSWHKSELNAYATSDIDAWLNSTYKALLDADIQSAIGTTKFNYTPIGGTNALNTLSRAVFLLSVNELGRKDYSANAEGSVLAIASILQIAYRNGSAVSQWTRSPYIHDTATVCYLDAAGKLSSYYSCTYFNGSRPAFTLPSTIAVQQ